jgi:RimJ/RimL family protein N-acetyltransferase
MGILDITKLKQIIKVKNFLTGEEGNLIPLSKENEISETDLARIAEICNSEKNKCHFISTGMDFLKTQNYTISNAKFWVEDLGWKGWENNSNFVFIVKNSNKEIVCAIDIKEADIESSEIGYWASENDKGWMTNTVIALINKAKLSGFKGLIALTWPDGFSSQRILQRAGFKSDDLMVEKNKEAIKFSIKL